MSCAFCRKPGPLTREHIWPKWLHDSHEYSLKYHSAPDKVLPAEQVIKDVCAECNNGPLSALDNYVRSLHDCYFSKGYQTIKKATFTYDFEKLTKWLLKVSYNSARASRAPDVELLSLYAPYIITPGCLPAFAAISVSLLGQLIVIDRHTGSIRKTELTWCRSGSVSLSASHSAIMSVRMIIINSWRFLLVVMKDTKLKAGDSDLVLSMLQGAVIRPNSPRTKVPTIPLDGDGILNHYRDKQHLYSAASHKLRLR
jgi:hypothetical protein